MGVPAFFRWLERQCTDITTYCVEEKVVTDPNNGQKIYPGMAEPNPNGQEFDNFYLDMNGIIHPCSHPEDRPAPRNEDEIMICIFDNIDRIMNIVRPRKVLYMAIDGVAPRAKMNQQRSRRFRAAKESQISHDTKSLLKKELEERGIRLPGPDPKKMRFDSNCITPGTPFMDKLATCLRYYIYDRLTNDPGWRNIKVILSDASVPGEGEHKIMDYIRRQRAVSGHDPNTKHCIAGADADLIMLGLATHEPWFTILRDEFVPNKPSPCGMCGKMGHDMEECQGLEDDEEVGAVEFVDTKYIFIHLKIVREWLTLEMDMSDVAGFKQDIENVIDDWILLCFFVGNDFLPHLPSLEIREGAINKLVGLYKTCVKNTRGYMTKNGRFDLTKVEFIMQNIGKMEDEIFRSRHKKEQHFANRRKRDQQAKRKQEQAARDYGKQDGNTVAAGRSILAENKNKASHDKHRQSENEKLKNSLSPVADALKLKKRKQNEEDPADNVKLHEAGWKERYYQGKFNVSSNDEAFKRDLVKSYTEGLAWVLAYYFQGCKSWEWYFPYHYAPFASDFKDLASVKIKWPEVSIPRNPLEQLMCVFPAGSKQFLPKSWQLLMTRDDSAIIDFYPTDFKLDLNGKRFEWMGVALLPFVDEDRLKRTLRPVYPKLNADEIHRNTRGESKLFVSKWNPLYQKFKSNMPNDTKTFNTIKGGGGFSGSFSVDPRHPVNCEIEGMASPIGDGLMDNLKKVCATAVAYRDPQFPKNHEFIPKLLPGVKMPEFVGLTARMQYDGRNQYSNKRDYRRGGGRRDNDVAQSQHRMINNSMGGPNRGRGGNNNFSQNQGNRHNNRGGGPIRHQHNAPPPQQPIYLNGQPYGGPVHYAPQGIPQQYFQQPQMQQQGGQHGGQRGGQRGGHRGGRGHRGNRGRGGQRGNRRNNPY